MKKTLSTHSQPHLIPNISLPSLSSHNKTPKIPSTESPEISHSTSSHSIVGSPLVKSDSKTSLVSIGTIRLEEPTPTSQIILDPHPLNETWKRAGEQYVLKFSHILGSDKKKAFTIVEPWECIPGGMILERKGVAYVYIPPEVVISSNETRTLKKIATKTGQLFTFPKQRIIPKDTLCPPDFVTFKNSSGDHLLRRNSNAPGKQGNTSSVFFFNDEEGNRYVYKMAAITQETEDELKKVTALHNIIPDNTLVITPSEFSRTTRLYGTQLVTIFTSIEFDPGAPSIEELTQHPLTATDLQTIITGAHTLLQYLHSLNIIHFDLNAGNILVNLHTGIVRFIDLAKADSPTTEPIKDPSVCTPILPPEFFERDTSFFNSDNGMALLTIQEKKASDWWSLGITLLEATLDFKITRAWGTPESRAAIAPFILQNDLSSTKKEKQATITQKIHTHITRISPNDPLVASTYFLGLLLTSSPSKDIINVLINTYRPEFTVEERNKLSQELAKYLCPLQERLSLLSTRYEFLV